MSSEKPSQSINAQPEDIRTGVTVHGARTHNLRDVSFTFPRDAMVVFTGISGSGKSSLAFDTLYAEAQRRFMVFAPSSNPCVCFWRPVTRWLLSNIIWTLSPKPTGSRRWGRAPGAWVVRSFITARHPGWHGFPARLPQATSSTNTVRACAGVDFPNAGWSLSKSPAITFTGWMSASLLNG